MQTEFTADQAKDLARHFLGHGWIADTDGTIYWVIRNTGIVRLTHTGRSWREAFRKAGVKLPVRRRFAAIDKNVMQDDKCVAVACSPTFARRTANALNEYEPDRRGL